MSVRLYLFIFTYLRAKEFLENKRKTKKIESNHDIKKKECSLGSFENLKSLIDFLLMECYWTLKHVRRKFFETEPVAKSRQKKIDIRRRIENKNEK